MSEPRNFIKVTSPEGTLNYPQSLQRPNTKFDPKGCWQADLVIPAAEGLAFKEQIEQLFEEQIEPSVRDYNKLSKKKVPIKAPSIKEDEEGNLIFKLKMKTETSSGKKQRPILVMENGQPLGDVSLASGTKARVGIKLTGWYASAMGIGVRLEPAAVSITDLVEYIPDSGFDFAVDRAAYKEVGNEETTEEVEEDEEDEEEEDF